MGDIEKAKLQFIQCFMCNGWTPPNLTRQVILEGVQVQICISCHKKLTKRVEALEIEERKLEEELEAEDEIASAFGATGRTESGHTSSEETPEDSEINIE